MTIKEQSINLIFSGLTVDENSDYSLWKATTTIKRPITSVPPIIKENAPES